MELGEIMTSQVEVIQPDDTLQSAAKKMRDRNIGFLPVCDGETLMGVLSDRDITIRALADGMDVNVMLARDLMTTPAIYCFEDQDVAEAARIMAENQIRRLVVLSRDDKRLVGVVSLRDLILAQPDTLIETLVERDVMTVDADDDQERVAELMSKYDLLAMPVVEAIWEAYLAKMGLEAGPILAQERDVRLVAEVDDLLVLAVPDEERRAPGIAVVDEVHRALHGVEVARAISADDQTRRIRRRDQVRITCEPDHRELRLLRHQHSRLEARDARAARAPYRPRRCPFPSRTGIWHSDRVPDSNPSPDRRPG